MLNIWVRFVIALEAKHEVISAITSNPMFLGRSVFADLLIHDPGGQPQRVRSRSREAKHESLSFNERQSKSVEISIMPVAGTLDPEVTECLCRPE
jgi:hypothetical protein